MPAAVDHEHENERPAWDRDLNDEQRKAVIYRDGPLAVLAGPGTGKTRVITHRIARLIEADGAEPESIVALTFTVKAAQEMRERLAGLVGPATAHRVNAHTFHGFGRLLLRRFGDVIGLSRRWMLIDSAQRTRLLREIILDGRLFDGAAARGRTAEAPALEGFISACRNAAIFPPDCLAFARKWSAACERNEHGLEPSALAAEAARAAIFADRARGYAAFDKACRQRHWLTFEDLITLPIHLLRTDRRAADICRGDYTHIVVDEFQDVNGAQIELLRLLAPPGRKAGPDLCVVGDDDQAIYAFRGASERTFAHFARIWSPDPKHGTIPLKFNYRSAEPILAAAGAVIARAAGRFAPEKQVHAGTAKQSEGAGPVEGVLVVDDGLTPAAISAMIRADRAANPERPWREYAVIVRNNAWIDTVGPQLELDGIPVRYLHHQRFGDEDVVRDLTAWIELLTDSAARWAVQRVLARPPLSIPAEVVSPWAQEHKAHQSRAHAGGPSRDPGRDVPEADTQPFVERLRHTAGRAEAPDGLRRFLDIHGELMALTLTEPADAVILRIIDAAGLAETEPAAGPAPRDGRRRARRLSALAAFLRFARSRVERLEPPGGLAEFWSYYQDLNHEDRRSLCADERELLDAAPETDPPAGADAADGDADAVTVLTAHKAKGLEFDVVFLPKVRPRGYPTSSREEEDEPLPPGLLAAHDPAGAPQGDPQIGRADEERRVFYVACTRARRRLVLFAKNKKSRGEAADYFIELTHDHTGLVAVRSADAILAGIATGAGAGSAAPAADELASFADAADPRSALGRRLRREARARIAALSNRAELGGAPAPPAGDDPIALAAEMARAGASLAMAAHVARRGEVPPWALAPGSPIGAEAAAVAQRLAAGDPPDTGPLLRPMAPPLKLSYSKIDSYTRCPRCFYLSACLNLGEDEGAPMIAGIAGHAALERFYRLVRDADAAGDPSPGQAELVRFALEEFDRAWPRSRPVDRAARDRLAAQLAHFHNALHDPAAHILEIETPADFTYERGGHRHTISVKFDRIDQLEDPPGPGGGRSERAGGVRLIDYKTGAARPELLEPRPDNLQLGIYAMAARHYFADPALRGRAEFWVLATGERGVIDFDRIDLGAVRATIDAAIDGMLAGRFDRSPKCKDRACSVFGFDDDA